MKKIQLKFAAEQMTKEQMKNVWGGKEVSHLGCWASYSEDCDKDPLFMPCQDSWDCDHCQNSLNNICGIDDCCDNVDCGC